MAIWRLKTTWIEDGADASEEWEVNAETAYDAVKEIMTRLRFSPHHVEAKRLAADATETNAATGLLPGQARRVIRTKE